MKDFILPMKKREKIAGWIYLPVHMVLMTLVILPALVVALGLNGITVDTVQLNTVYYLVGFIYILIFMMSFLRSSFTMERHARLIPTVAMGFLAYYAMNFAVNCILLLVTENVINPNTEAVNEAVSMNIYVMVAVSVILAPIVEEVLFRGVVFGTIRTRNRVLAYVVSVLLFSVYHLWASVLAYSDWTILIYIIQYIPAGLVLAWTYEKYGSIWGPIILHMFINALAVLANIMV